MKNRTIAGAEGEKRGVLYEKSYKNARGTDGRGARDGVKKHRNRNKTAAWPPCWFPGSPSNGQDSARMGFAASRQRSIVSPSSGTRIRSRNPFSSIKLLSSSRDKKQWLTASICETITVACGAAKCVRKIGPRH